MTSPSGWGTLPRFLITFAVIAAGMVVMGRELYFGTPLYETGDLAANSLEIIRAVHLQADHANYSRFDFYHPGPAFWYVYGAGEVLFFRLLHIVPAPHNGQLLAGALLQSAFLAAAITVATGFVARNRGLFATAAIVVALVHFRLAGDLEFALWPPNHLIMPFACFIVVSAAVARGRLELAPLLLLSGGFLAHGHVAQPLFVVPIGSLALGLGVRSALVSTGLTLPGLVRRRIKPALAALAVLAVFLLPLVADATRGPDSNLAAIFTYFTGPNGPTETHAPWLAVPYVLAFLGYPADHFRLDFSGIDLGSFAASHWPGFALTAAFLAVLPAVLVARSMRRGSPARDGESGSLVRPLVRPLATCYAFLALAAGLCFVWAAIQRGPLYQFNAFFIYGLTFAAALPPLVLACGAWPSRRSKPAMLLLGLVALSLTAALTPPLPLAENPNGLALNDAVREVVAQRKNDKAVLLEFRDRDWPSALAVALALQRSHVRWFVDPGRGLAFGDHVFVPGPGGMAGIEKWFLEPPSVDHPGQIMLGPEIALYPPPESISRYHFAVRTASPVVAGGYHSVVVTQLDAYGNVAVGYHGTVRFASSDPAATLPPDYTFTTPDRGVHYFMYKLALRTPGFQTVTVADVWDPSDKGGQVILVLEPSIGAALGVGP